MASAKELPPGGEGKIDVTFDTRNKRGPNSKDISVISNDPVEGTVKLTIKANLEVLIGLEPQYVNFGSIPFDGEGSQRVAIIGSAAGDVKILGVGPQPTPEQGAKPVSANIDKIRHKVIDERRQPDGKLWLELSIGPGNLEPGRLFGTLMIKTDHEKAGEIELRVSGKIEGPVSINPERLYFPNLEAGVEQTRSVIVAGSKKEPIKVLSVAVSDPTLSAKFSKREDGDWDVTVTSNGRLEQERATAELTIKTSSAKVPEVKVPITLYKKRDVNSAAGSASIQGQAVPGDPGNLSNRIPAKGLGGASLKAGLKEGEKEAAGDKEKP